MAKRLNKREDLQLDARNANKGTERGRYMLEQSLRECGAGRSILADKEGRIIAGNKTLEVAEALDIPVRVVETDGKELVVVQRSDLDLDSEQARKLAYYDNRSSEVGLAWDASQIAADLEAGLDLGAMFKEDEIAVLVAKLEPEKEAPEAQIDKAEELREKWQTERGQLWEIGKHRLLCGDSTVAEDVQRLFGEERLSLVWTDPPYGVSYGEKNRYLQSIGPADRLLGDIEGDDLKPEDVFALVYGALSQLAQVANKGAVAYVAAPPGPLHWQFIRAMNASGFQYRHQLIWLKNQLVFGRSDYMYKHEPILYGWLQNGAHYFEPTTNNCTVFEFDRPRASKLHPTEKPVELVGAMIANSSRRDETVADAFCGSGTTMVAAEQLGRRCYSMEIEPKYVAVTLQRMADMGLEPHLDQA